MAQSGTAGLLTNDERERRQTIYKLGVDLHAIDIEQEYFKGKKRHFALNVRRNRNRERNFNTNKPIGIITKG